ncbi:MAG: transcription elongation factor GreA [Dehalococcoidia bacterium]|nr:transcription elongation factor GreA [Dehalococcoidia bacterium]
MADDSTPARPVTLTEALAEYLQTLKPDVRAGCANYLQGFVNEFNGKRVTDLTGSLVESFAERKIVASDPAAGDRVAALKAWFQYLKKKEYAPVNYGVHIRVRRAAGRAAMSGTRVEQAPIEMTADGIHSLKSQLDELVSARGELVKAVEVARSDGDLRENAPYHAAREALGFHEQKIKEIETALGRAVVVEASDERSTVGSTVRVVNIDTETTHEWMLVGAREANAAEQRISVESPVGKELLGRRPGEEVVVTTPRGSTRFRVESIARR